MRLSPFKKKSCLTNAFSEFDEFHHEMNKLFDLTFLGNSLSDSAFLKGSWLPAIDIVDSKETIVITADLPGLTKEEIDVSVKNNVLTIKGDKKEAKLVKDKNYFRSERVSGSFYRKIQLPVGIDENKVDAKYENGVLTLNINKREEEKSKTIKVQ